MLQQDNADERLTPLGREIGLISDRRWAKFLDKQEKKAQELKRITNTILPPSEELNALLVSHETSPVVTGTRLSDLLRRPQLNYTVLEPVDRERPNLPGEIFEICEVEVKYEGYIKRQKAQIEEMRRLEGKKLPPDLDYRTITGLRLEAQEKLNKIRPRSVGQASRISGVSPADVSVLLIWLAGKGGENHGNHS